MFTKRIYKFDNLKFILILFVVIGHFADIYANNYGALQSIFIFVYSFHMPLFIFLTGLFQKKIKKVSDIPIKKIIFYILLIFFMKITIFYISERYSFGYSFEVLSGSEVYWYLNVVILYMLIGPIINKLKFSYLFIFSIVLALFAGYDNNINDFLYLSRAIVFFPFYLLGHNYSNNKEKIINICNKKGLKLISIIIIIIFMYICIYELSYIYKYRTLFTGRNPYDYIAAFTVGYKDRILTYLISFIMGFSIMCLIPNKKIKIIKKKKKRTLPVYVLHFPILLLMRGLNLFDILEKNFGDNFIYILLLISIILTFFLSLRIFTKLFNLIYNKIFI